MSSPSGNQVETLACKPSEETETLTPLHSLASAFTALTTSFVSDIILPPLSVILPLNRNLDEKFAVLQAGPNFAELDGYTTLAQAQEDGAVVLAYG